MALYRVKVIGRYTTEMLVTADGAFEARVAAAKEFADVVERAILADDSRQSVAGEVEVDSAVCVTEFA